MWDGVDATGYGKAPIKGNNIYLALYFLAFIVIGR
jgi:hypothetical protein